MSLASATHAPRASSPWGADAPTLRARALLQGGLVGGHAAAITVTGLSMALGGPRAAASAAIAAAVTIAFFAIGQGVQVVYAKADPRRVMIASLASYLIRVGLLGGLLVMAMRSERVSSALNTTAVFAGVAVTVIGWLAFEILAYRKLRIPIYDTEYVPPSELGGSK